MLLLFFHTLCQTWSHSTRLQTTESHTRVFFFLTETHRHRCSEGRGGFSFTLNPPFHPHAGPISYIFSYFFFVCFSFFCVFLAKKKKVKFVRPQKSGVCVRLHTLTSSHDPSMTSCFIMLLCGDTLPELSSDFPSVKTCFCF